PGQAGDGERVSLGYAGPAQQGDHLRRHHDPAGRDGLASRDVLAGHVDHPGRAGLVDMGQTFHHQNSSSSGTTVTVSPASTEVTDSGTTISASDSARSPIMCDPWLPTGVTARWPSTTDRVPRANCRLPSGERRLWVRTASASGRTKGCRPISLR